MPRTDQRCKDHYRVSDQYISQSLFDFGKHPMPWAVLVPVIVIGTVVIIESMTETEVASKVRRLLINSISMKSEFKTLTRLKIFSIGLL